MFANKDLAKAIAIKDAADALVTSTEAAKNADGATQDDIDAYDAAVAAATIAATNVTTEQGKVTTATTNLANYSADV